jgi:oxygen-independent coproporphyrinogen-3 oxidase
VLSCGELQRLIAHALSVYDVSGLEFTVEAGRPDTVDSEKLRMLKRMGVSRISLNPQSMNEQTLRRIGREHTPEDLRAAYFMAMDAGIDNVNMDIIAGLPGETAADIEETLAAIEALSPASLTVHTLAVKRSSRLKERLEEYPLPTAAETARMTEKGALSAMRMGMRPYYMYRQKYMSGSLENVGYAKKGFECIYNVDMMEEAVNILAHGAGAMTKRVFHARDARVERIPAPKDIGTYIRKLETMQYEKEVLFF